MKKFLVVVLVSLFSLCFAEEIVLHVGEAFSSEIMKPNPEGLTNIRTQSFLKENGNTYYEMCSSDEHLYYFFNKYDVFGNFVVNDKTLLLEIEKELVSDYIIVTFQYNWGRDYIYLGKGVVLKQYGTGVKESDEQQDIMYYINTYTLKDYTESELIFEHNVILSVERK